MTATRAERCDQTYALRLHAPRRDGAVAAGELEHVLSGDCRTFDSDVGLLLALQGLRALQVQRALHGPGTPLAPLMPVTPDCSLAAPR